MKKKCKNEISDKKYIKVISSLEWFGLKCFVYKINCLLKKNNLFHYNEDYHLFISALKRGFLNNQILEQIKRREFQWIIGFFC